MEGYISYFTEREQEFLQDVLALVHISTPSNQKEKIDEGIAWCAGWVQQHLQVNSEVISGEKGNHLVFEYGQGETRAILVSHVDTVWDTPGPKVRQEENRLYGPGIFDMKTGLLMGLWALKAHKELGVATPRVRVLITADEEVGSETSRAIIEEMSRNMQLAIVLEPAVGLKGALKTSRKGVGRYSLHVQGRAAHAGGEPEKGINANVELAHQIGILYALNHPEEGTTVNPGVIQGGTRSNVIPEKASVEIDVRVRTVEAGQRVDAAIKGLTPYLPGAILTVEGGLNRPPMERTAGINKYYTFAQRIMGEVGRPLPETATGGGSDGNFIAALGVAVLDGFGAVGAGAHADYEHIDLNFVVERLSLLAAVVERYVQA